MKSGKRHSPGSIRRGAAKVGLRITPRTEFGTGFGIAEEVTLRVAVHVGIQITFRTGRDVGTGFGLTAAIAVPLAFEPEISHEIAVQTSVRLAI